MKNRFRLYRRTPGGAFYIHDSETGKQESLGTRDRAEARALLNARNESVRQPQLNLQIARAYLAGSDSGVSTRTWQNALDAIVEMKSGSTQDRWRRAANERALDLIRERVIIETQAEQLLACLKAGTVSTNVHLRKLHNFCLSMNWLPCCHPWKATSRKPRRGASSSCRRSRRRAALAVSLRPPVEPGVSNVQHSQVAHRHIPATNLEAKVPMTREKSTPRISETPRPLLLIHGEKAHSRYFSETAYKAAAEPKELVIIEGANHVDLYDQVKKIPWDKLTSFFTGASEMRNLT